MSSNGDEQFSFEPILLALRENWLLIVAASFCFGLIGILISVFTPLTFMSRASIYVNSPSIHSRSNDELSSGLISPIIPNLSTQIAILQEPNLTMSVIGKLGLNAELKPLDFRLPDLRTTWLGWRLVGRSMDVFQENPQIQDLAILKPTASALKYRLKIIDRTKYALYNHDGKKLLAIARNGEKLSSKQIAFILDYKLDQNLKKGDWYALKIEPEHSMLRGFQKNYLVSVDKSSNIFGENSNLIQVFYKSRNPFTARKVLNTLFAELRSQQLNWSASDSRGVMEYVEEQLTEMRDKLAQSSRSLSDFQKQSGLMSLEPQVEADIKQLVEYEVQSKNAELQTRDLQRLANALKDGIPQKFVLSPSQQEDSVLATLTLKLAGLESEIGAMRSQFKESYPELKLKISERDAVLKETRAMIDNRLKQAQAKRNDLQGTVAEFKQRFNKLPDDAMILADLIRSQRVYEELYLFLVKERDKARISEVKQMNSIKIVNEAILPIKQDSPDPKKSALLGFIFGFILMGVWVVYNSLNSRVFRTREEIKALGKFKVLGVLPSAGKDITRPQIFRTHDFIDQLQLIRSNLDHFTEPSQRQTILISSPEEGDGKTTFAANLAYSMSRSLKDGERVALLELSSSPTNFRKIFNLDTDSKGIWNYLEDKNMNEPPVLNSKTTETRLDLWPAGYSKGAISEALESERFSTLWEAFRAKYQSIVIDAPSKMNGGVASLMLAKQVDQVILVCRIGKTSRKELEDYCEQIKEFNPNCFLVLNQG
ncbi:MAG: Wzz/FepE/Etk N-terminal domain-containing protein [Candidatus Caenarcaniphilales bacterium]|nr:Wzz/FepE/Etk N-terminal domain-containing protein [Candidatus Caenarcaniphilales bacterium]